MTTKVGAVFKHIYVFTARDRHGNLLWEDRRENLTTNEGLDEILDKFWKGSNYTAAFYVGLTADSPTFAAGDTMSSHSGWTEVTAYDEATREALTLGSVSGQSVSNTGSKAQFTISTNGTDIGGAFISTNSTKGGSTGILIGGAALSSDRVLNDGDTLDITVTLTAASA